MSRPREYPRCEDRCRRTFGGWEAMRRHQTNGGRCKTKRELLRDGHLVERADGVWVQVHRSKVTQQLRLAFPLGRPRPEQKWPSRVRSRIARETASAKAGTTNAGVSHPALWMLGGAA